MVETNKKTYIFYAKYRAKLCQISRGATLSQKMKKLFFISSLAITLLSGCASTGVVPMGQNLYTISKTSPACGFRDAGGVRAEIFQEMSQYCSEKRLQPEVVTIEALDGVIGRRCASATVEFRCVKASEENLTPTGISPARDMNRNPNIPTDLGQYGRKPNEPMRIKQDIRVQEPDDIYTELKKLKELLDNKVITQEEFDERKKKILAK